MILFDINDKKAKFSFEMISEKNKLIIFEESKISVIDLTNFNEIIGEVTAAELQMQTIYPQEPFSAYKYPTFQSYQFDDESTLLMMVDETILLLDISNLEDGIVEKARAGLAKKAYTRNHHCYINTDTRSIFIS